MNESALADRPRMASAVPVADGYALQTAEQAYRRVLADQPRHLRALCGLATVRGQLGAIDEARDLLGWAVDLAGLSAEDHVVLGTTFIRINDLESAQRQFEIAVAIDEKHAAARFHLANVLSGRGNIAEAALQYEKVLALDPNHAEAHQNLGLALQTLGQFDSAATHHQAALAMAPKSTAIHASLGDAYRHMGRHEDAIAQYAQAIAINPGLTDLHINLGGCFHATGRREPAIRSYLRALAVNPGLASAHYNLGILYAELDNPDAAIAHYERAISLLPGSAEAHYNLANVLRRRHRHPDAIEHFKEAIRLKPDYVVAQLGLGDALQSQKQIDGAIVCFRAALANKPGDATTLNRLASALLVAGRIEEASRAFEAAIEITPDNIGIQHNYASVRPFTAGDRRLAGMEDLLARADRLSDEQLMVLHFTLGKAYADLKEADRSFDHLVAANRLKRRQMSYDERGTLTLMQRIRDTFSSEVVGAKSNAGYGSQSPIFVLGMPRSGTSLVEQIIASHPRVFGAGELTDLVATTSIFSSRTASPYPELLAKLSDNDLREFGKTYVERLGGITGDCDRVVDKLPANFVFAGLIHLALPQARIIHVRRDPLDTCLSCYSLLFAEEQPYAYDLGELGRY